MEIQNREFKIFITGRDKAERTISASISSEEPVERFGKDEVLLHTEEAVDLSRAPLPLLTSHDADQVPVGIVENLKIVGRKLRGVLRFGSSAKARELWEDVRGGVLRGLSIGYQVHETEPQGRDAYNVTRWMPYEVSLVSVPADATVGIGRSLNIANKGALKMDISRREKWGEYASKANAILETARAENRGMSEVEAANFQGYADKFDELSLIIGEPTITIRELGVAGAMERLAQPTSTPLMHRYSIEGEKKTEKGKPFSSMGEQMRAIANAETPGSSTDRRLDEIRTATGLGESIPSDGGFLVQEDFSNDIVMSAFETGKLGKLCRKIQISGNANSVKIPGLDETSRATGSRQGGVRGYYVSEASEINASTPKFRRIEMNLNKLCVLVYSTEELLADAGLLENVVKNAAIHEISFQIDDAILNGLGSGMPLGVLQAASLVPQAAETGQASGTIDLLNCTKLWSRLLPGSRETAVWVISPGVEQALYHMSLAVGTGGSAVFLPGGGASDAPYSTLMGRPLIVHESAQAIGTQGDILLGDFKNGYILAEKVGGIKSSISIHVRFIYDEQVFKFTYRYDGQPVLAASGGITPFKGSDKLGHFVALADR